MSLINTSDSYSQSETLPLEIPTEKSDIPVENFTCDTDSVYDSCRLKMGEIKDIDIERKKAVCLSNKQEIKRTDESPCNQDCITDSTYIEGISDKMTTELLLSKETISHFQNEDDTKVEESNKTNFSINTLEESTDAVSIESFDESLIIDSKRTRRCSKRKRDIEDFCPVCGVTVRFSELANHFAKEVENLSKISKSIRKSRYQENRGVSTTFVQIRSNRENRHAAKVAKFSTRSRNDVYCPVCNFRLTGTQDEINNHVLNCINEDDDYGETIVVDVEDENSFEEYEFANQTRVRAISMVPGGYRALQGDTSRRTRNYDVDDDLNVDVVDVDDTLAYGNPQYTELDVIHNATDNPEKEQLEQLRKAVLVDPTAERQVLESRKWANNCDDIVNSEESCSSLDKSRVETNAVHDASKVTTSENIEDEEDCGKGATYQILLSLREKIKDLEEQNKSVKCLICLEPYTKPVVSTSCWHVHCEECWLMTMGVKKLCPQCNMIVFPSDLRRIYL